MYIVMPCRWLGALAGAAAAAGLALASLLGLLVLAWGWSWAEQAGYRGDLLEIDG